MTTASSKDFYKVQNNITVTVPSKLIHKNVMSNPTVAGEETFSIERKHLVKIVDLPTKTISMTLGGLEPLQSSRKHRHNYETIIYIVKGIGKTIVENEEVYWENGDAIYIPVWAWHQQFNLSDKESCIYVACENAPMLQNLGNIALREEYQSKQEKLHK